MINVYIDLETGAFDPLTEGVVEIGLVAFDLTDGEITILETKRVLVCKQPKKKYSWKPERLLIDGDQRVPYFKAWSILYDFIKKYIDIPNYNGSNLEGSIWGHGSAFDFNFLRQFEKEVSDTKIFQSSYIDGWFCCTKKEWLSMKSKGIVTGGSKLEDLGKYFNYPVPQTHTALEDAIMGVTVLGEMIKLQKDWYNEL